MSLPVLSKNWNFLPNQLLTETLHGPIRKALMFDIVNVMTGSAPLSGDSFVASGGGTAGNIQFWEVVSSSNGTAVATGSLNWSVASDCVWATKNNPHSWVVLKQSDFFGAADHLEICINLSSNNDGAIGCYATRNDGVNFNGFSGGTTTNRPTAADGEMLILEDGSTTANTGGWMGSDGSTVDARRYSVSVSDDGYEWRISMFTGGVNVAMWVIGQPLNPPTLDVTGAAGWDFPVLAMVYALDNDTTNIFRISQLTSITSGKFPIAQLSAGESYKASMGGKSIGGDLWVTRQPAGGNAFDARRDLEDMDVILLDSVYYGRMGWIKDFWWANGDDLTGDGYPADGTVKFAKVSEAVMPWIGDSTLLLTSS